MPPNAFFRLARRSVVLVDHAIAMRNGYLRQVSQLLPTQAFGLGLLPRFEPQLQGVASRSVSAHDSEWNLLCAKKHEFPILKANNSKKYRPTVRRDDQDQRNLETMQRIVGFYRWELPSWEDRHGKRAPWPKQINLWLGEKLIGLYKPALKKQTRISDLDQVARGGKKDNNSVMSPWLERLLAKLEKGLCKRRKE
jgi:hypothetical protein